MLFISCEEKPTSFTVKKHKLNTNFIKVQKIVNKKHMLDIEEFIQLVFHENIYRKYNNNKHHTYVPPFKSEKRAEAQHKMKLNNIKKSLYICCRIHTLNVI